jgi:thioredoxin-related protein
MRHLRSILAASLLAVSVGAFAQHQAHDVASMRPVGKPAPTAKLLSKAEATAKASGKNVLVIFHASWCGWCKKLDAFMQDPQYKQIFDDNFVVVKLTVLETDDQKVNENPGGIEEMDALGGRDAGLPLFAILNPQGKMVMNSMFKSEGQDKPANTGFPAASEEVDHFAAMMKAGAPKATPEQIKAMCDYLTAQEAARKAAAAKAAGGGH